MLISSKIKQSKQGLNILKSEYTLFIINFLIKFHKIKIINFSFLKKFKFNGK